MAIWGPEHDRTIMEFTERLEEDVYVRDFFPPDDDDDGVPLTGPTPHPSMPDMKSFDADDDLSKFGYATAEKFGAFALAAMGNSDQKVVLA